MALDYPQLFTASRYNMSKFPLDDFKQKHQELADYKKYIKAIHIWGKIKNSKNKWIAHSGNLDTLFDFDKRRKMEFLKIISEFYDDNVVRYFVPEVNSSSEDLKLIINDFLAVGADYNIKNRVWEFINLADD